MAGGSSISPPRRRFASSIAWAIGRPGGRDAAGEPERPGARDGPMIPFGKREFKVCIMSCLFWFCLKEVLFLGVTRTLREHGVWMWWRPPSFSPCRGAPCVSFQPPEKVGVRYENQLRRLAPVHLRLFGILLFSSLPRPLSRRRPRPRFGLQSPFGIRWACSQGCSGGGLDSSQGLHEGAAVP